MGQILLPTGLAATTPSAGYGTIYVKSSDKKLYLKDETGTESPLSSPASTDALSEGVTNLYYTDTRVRAAVQTGLVDTAGTPAATDSLLTILGKIKKGFFTDHSGLGGSIHANVVAGGAAGFMSGTDKTKLDLVSLASSFTTAGAFALTLTASATTNATVPAGTINLGYLGSPVNSQSTAYTAVLADAGKTLLHPSTDANARTFTIPANASVAYEVGTMIGFVNRTSQVLSIAITTDTMTLVNTTTTGTRSLALNGSAIAYKDTATTWVIAGTGLT
jgi:hypothetical protein